MVSLIYFIAPDRYFCLFLLFVCAILSCMFYYPHPNMPKITRPENVIGPLFAQNFKKARKEAKVTQAQLEERTGIRQTYISDVENAKKPISMETANILAGAINKPLWQLLTPVKK